MSVKRESKIRGRQKHGRRRRRDGKLRAERDDLREIVRVLHAALGRLIGA